MYVTTIVNSLLAVLYIIIINGATGYMVYKLVESIADLRKGIIFKIGAFVSLTIVSITVIFIGDATNIIFTLIGFALIMFICYKDSIIHKLSAILLLFPLIISINAMVDNLDTLLLSFNYAYFDKLLVDYNIYIYIFARAIFTLIFWLPLYLTLNKRMKNAKKYIQQKAWIIIDMICSAHVVSLLACIALPNYEMDIISINYYYITFVIAIICIFSNIGINILLGNLINMFKEQSDNKIYKLQQDYYVGLEKEQNEVRKIHHDMNNHLNILSNYVTRGEAKDAREYLEKLRINSPVTTNKTFCQNSLVNAVINNKYSTMLEKDIDFDVNISLDNIIGVDDFDLCVIFANALDNAIEACEKVEDKKRRIQLKARADKGFLSFYLMNSKSNPVIEKSGRIISTKENKQHHGFGFPNLKEIVDKYDGNLEIKYDENSFTVQILMKTV